ncbi:MAG: GlsB/YeaQ/YmgE family stress response membrane protein [Chloroflexi bacterium]|nr:GlsB/YeaQ/YmgE family stress response membrane protein [Chloroflexota bacterium]
MFDIPGFSMGPVGWIVIGLLAGAISGVLVRGRTARGCLPNIAIGILGGIVGGFIATEVLNMGETGGFISALIVASLGAILVRFLLEFTSGDRRR